MCSELCYQHPTRIRDLDRRCVLLYGTVAEPKVGSALCGALPMAIGLGHARTEGFPCPALPLSHTHSHPSPLWVS